MRIALLASLRYPIAEPYAGGLERHTHQLAAGLAAAGHEVSLLAASGSTAPAGVELIEVEGVGTNAYRRAERIVGSGNYDLLHDNSTHWLPLAANFLRRTPTVTTLHTPPYRRHTITLKFIPRGRRHRFVAISHALATEWKKLTGACTVVHNGVDVSRWPFSASAAPKTALWYGRLTPEKGAEYAIRAALKAGFRIRVAGPVTDPAYYRECIAPLLAEDAVDYLGHLPQREIAALAGKSAVGLFTSVWREPFGLVIPELLACGTPVAGFRSGAAPELVDATVSALVGVRDTEALANVLDRAAALDRHHCRKFVEQRHGTSKMIEGYVKVYEQF